jgi:hypothetical protein
MQQFGEIVTDNKTYGYPWIGAKIARQNAKLSHEEGGKEQL